MKISDLILNAPFQNNNEIQSPSKNIKFLVCKEKGVVECKVDISYDPNFQNKQLITKHKEFIVLSRTNNKHIIKILYSSETKTLISLDSQGDIQQYQFDEFNFQYFQTRCLKKSDPYVQNMEMNLNCLEMSFSNNFLLSNSQKLGLILWNMANGQKISSINSDKKYHNHGYQGIISCSWSKDDSFIASGDDRGAITVWAMPQTQFNDSNQVVAVRSLQDKGDYSEIRCLKFSQLNPNNLFTLHNGTNYICMWQLEFKNKDNDTQTTTNIIEYQNPLRKSNTLSGFIQQFAIDAREEKIMCGAQQQLDILNATTLEKIQTIDINQLNLRLNLNFQEIFWIWSVSLRKDDLYIALVLTNNKAILLSTVNYDLVTVIDDMIDESDTVAKFQY